MKAVKYLAMLILIASPGLFAQNITNYYSSELSRIKTKSSNKFIADSVINNEDTNKTFPEMGFIAGPHSLLVTGSLHCSSGIAPIGITLLVRDRSLTHGHKSKANRQR